MNNGHDFHVVAILKRGKAVVKIGACTHKTHPKSSKKFKSGDVVHSMHAEANVLRNYKPGDQLIVLRFTKAGELTMAKPCPHCQEQIEKLDLKKVVYSNWDGELVRL